jgi:hypothetical protein
VQTEPQTGLSVPLLVRAKCLILYGEPAGTRTQDHLIKSFPVTALSLAKSTVMVANFRAGYPLKEGPKRDGLATAIRYAGLACSEDFETGLGPTVIDHQARPRRYHQGQDDPPGTFCGHVGNALALSERSVMSTAVSANPPLMPLRQTAIGVRLAAPDVGDRIQRGLEYRLAPPLGRKWRLEQLSAR